MSDIQIKNNCVRFYGNPAGYLTEKSAVCDSMFDCGDLRDYLSRNGYPDGDSQLVWVRWTTPSTPQTMTIRVWVLQFEPFCFTYKSVLI